MISGSSSPPSITFDQVWWKTLNYWYFSIIQVINISAIETNLRFELLTPDYPLVKIYTEHPGTMLFLTLRTYNQAIKQSSWQLMFARLFSTRKGIISEGESSACSNKCEQRRGDLSYISKSSSLICTKSFSSPPQTSPLNFFQPPTMMKLVQHKSISFSSPKNHHFTQ